MDLGFEGLVVLALDLELGLEFFHQHFEAGDFDAKFLDVGGGRCGASWCLLVLARLVVLMTGACGLLAGKAGNRPGCKGIG